MHNYKTKIGPVELHFIWLKLECWKLEIVELRASANLNCQGLGPWTRCGVWTVDSWSGQHCGQWLASKQQSFEVFNQPNTSIIYHPLKSIFVFTITPLGSSDHLMFVDWHSNFKFLVSFPYKVTTRNFFSRVSYSPVYYVVSIPSENASNLPTLHRNFPFFSSFPNGGW